MLLMPLRWISIFGLLLCAIPSSAQRADQLLKAAGTPVSPKVSIAWDRYYDSEALAILCRKIADAYPNLARLQSIGRSQQGKELWLLTITDFTKGNPDRKAGMYVQGNIHGNEIQGGEYSLYLAWYLTGSFADVRYIRDMLAEKVFYIAPTINPDSRDYFIHKPTTAGDPRGFLQHPVREPRYHDLDGDGNIVFMRWKDRNGIWRIDPNDSRRMVQLRESDIINFAPDGERIAVTPDERNYSMAVEGDTYKFGMESAYYPADPGGKFNPRDPYDPNHNWDWNWEAGGKDPDGSSSEQPFFFPEIRSVRDFFLQHPNIATALSFHNSAGEIYTGSVKKPVKNTEDDDGFDMSRYYDVMGRHGEELLPGYRYVPQTNGGWFREVDWMYGRRGAYSFLVELAPDYTKNPGEPNVDEQYRFDRDLLFDDSFIPWHEFSHPTLGKIEIGGFKKNYAELRLTPGFLMESEAHRNMAFCLYLASETAKLEVRGITVKDKSDGLQEVTVLIANTHLLPTHSGPDLKHHIVRPDYVTLKIADSRAQIVAAEVEDGFNGHEAVDVDHETTEDRYLVKVENIPGHAAVAVRWIVRGGRGKYSVVVDSVKGGVAAGSSI